MSARALSVRNMQKVIQKREKEVTDPPDLGPDEMRLYSYYKPSLVAGNYQITAEQKITSATAASQGWGQQTLTIKNTKVRDIKGTHAPQEFEVVVPRFTLDPGLINSYYPPDGHQDEGRVLPHIVLNDPHYPWEIAAGVTERMSDPIDGPHEVLDKDNKPLKDQNQVPIQVFRSIVPWIALVVFDAEDLHLNKVDDLSSTGLFKNPQPEDLLKQNPKGTFSMTVQQYLNLPSSSRVKYEADSSLFGELQSMTSSVDIIFPTKHKFKEIFAYAEATKTDSQTTESDSTMANGAKGNSTKVDLTALEAHKYLAHVRHINTVGFPDAGVEEEGLYSIVVSSRLGAFDIDKPQTQICHLVSVEHVDSTLQDMGMDDSGRIGMVSLFSWIYTALPPNPVNFVDTVRNLVNNQQMLCVDQNLKVDVNIQTSRIMSDRLNQGYTLSRWRTQSGEQTAAFSRGPLVPGPVPHPIVNGLPDCSNTSQGYQILDPETGLMDLSYSSAWQLGKILAISDTTFSSALMRFRSVVHNASVGQTQMTANNLPSSGTALDAILSTVSTLKTMSQGSTGSPNRIITGSDKPPVPILQDPALKPLLLANMRENAVANASAGSGPFAEVYNEFNKQKGNNTDWAVILSWICEKLNLGGIPPQYLLPEPVFLPPESLRFFHIDDFWLDCLIDGALSVANHLESDDDTTRREIKNILNKYLSDDVKRAGYPPQVPCYGFVIRSQLIKAMPDLRITVTWQAIKDDKGAKLADNRAPVCRWTKWDNETLLCLLDRDPQDLESIVLAQPPHQQRFSLGSYVRKGSRDKGIKDLVEFDLRTLYTTDKPLWGTTDPKKDPSMATPDYPFGNTHDDEWPEKLLNPKYSPATWLNFETRVLRVNTLATDINAALAFGPDSKGFQYRDKIANSCELGLELNDPSYYFWIEPTGKVQPTVHNRRPPRQLYVFDSGITSLDAAEKAFSDSIKDRALPVSQDQKSTPTTIPMPIPAPRPAPTQNPDAAKSLKPPDQQTRLEPVPTSRTFDGFMKIPGSPLTSSALFTSIAIYADYKKPPQLPRNTTRFSRDDYIPDRNVYFFDLIFSIRKTAPMAQNLLRIDVDIPTAPNSSSKPGGPALSNTTPGKEPLLEGDYYGPGVRMLSNQRFIPFLFFNGPRREGGNGLMHIELRPRSADDNYAITTNDARTNDVGFRLAEAPISRVSIPSNVNIDGKNDDSMGRVEIQITEWYKTTAYPDGEPIRHPMPYVLLKRQIPDDKSWSEFGS
ncbi:hypothetical protein LTR84_008403 [Exophiala bonariae]|uniref:Uncharacterized protein n=1 Tax=Exophiala bonariae TaxID=1690606 RepID=A0AAV9MZ76_9EURO|nr:hypothetical protein LTR84_008403 [Exophiala bonariae]